MGERSLLQRGRQDTLAGDAEVHHLDTPHRSRGVEHQAELPGSHGSRDVRLHHGTVDLAGVGVEAGRNVDGHAQGVRRIHARDGGGRHAFHLRMQARSEERVHDDRRPAQPLPPRAGRAFRGQIDDRVRVEAAQNPQEHRRIAADLARWHGQKDLHRGAPAQQVACHDEAVPAVLPRTAHDARVEPREGRTLSGNNLSHPTSGVLHQHQPGKSQLLDDRAVDGAHLGRGEKERHAAPILLAMCVGHTPIDGLAHLTHGAVHPDHHRTRHEAVTDVQLLETRQRRDRPDVGVVEAMAGGQAQPGVDRRPAAFSRRGSSRLDSAEPGGVAVVAGVQLGLGCPEAGRGPRHCPRRDR